MADHWITSMFSLCNSRTIPIIRLPFTPIQAPIGSMRSSYDSTATLARSPGMRTTFFTVMSPSAISGTSCSKSFFKNSGEVRLRVMYGVVLFFISTLLMMARTVSFFLKCSPGICSLRGMCNSLPSSSSKRTSFPQVW